jgi:co-chaperonin GroES (HSP10)
MQFLPYNRWVVLKPIDETDKIGSLYLPGNIANQYRRAEVVALPPASPEKDGLGASGLVVGSIVFYDTVGEVRIGRGKDETILVSYLNILGTMVV